MRDVRRLAMLGLALGTVLVGGLAACGASNQSTHDGTTVTVQKPADSSAAPPPATGQTAK